MTDHPSRAAARSVTRRRALLAAGGVAVASCAPRTAPVVAPFRSEVFRHGVASGDPLQDRVILWTRVTTGSDQAVDVRWRIARDPELLDVVAQGTAAAEPARDFAVKVDAAGLAPGSAYHYGFEALGARSPTGRTRTLPEGGTEPVSLAVVSCANHAAGYFHVYRDIARRADADLVVHLGDYIYEYGPGGYATGWGERHGRVPDPPHEITTLADYRRRHAQYKEDQDLQDAHAAAPWIVVWDDHETADDAHVSGAQNHEPADGDWSARKEAAVQAYMEWTPIREPAPGRAREAIWRVFELGDLATLVMLETRLTARSPEISWNDAPVPFTADPEDPEARAGVEAFLRDVVGAPEREMLGRAQEAEVEAALSRSVAAGKPWRLLGNQVVMGSIASPDFVKVAPRWLRLLMRLRDQESYALLRRSAFGVPLSLALWDGYPAARERLYAAARRAGSQLLTLSGDSHTFMVNRLIAADGSRMGVEIGTSAVSSPSVFAQVPDFGVDLSAVVAGVNPQMAHFNGYDRGYVRLTLTRDEARAELRRVDTVEEREARVETYKTFRITRDEAGVLDVRPGD
jgi:phosphodiesterase/alkaline phosphatase D-like protein